MSEPMPSADRALRALAESLDGHRDRRPADRSDPAVPVAATLVLLRDGARGPEVLIMERPDRGSFAGAWVFPGGKLEPGDRTSPEEPEEDVARRAAIRETWEEIGLVVEPDALTTISCWDPPPGIAVRIRTWFFAARAPQGDLTPSPDEVVATAWLRPTDILGQHGQGEITLYPPTWVTLHGLMNQPDVEAILGAARVGGVHRFETVARPGASGPMLLWQGDADYEADAVAPASARHRLELAGLPWVYTRTD